MDQVDQAMMRFPEYRLSKGIEIYAPPVVLLLGTVGNLLSFVILMTKSMRTFSTYLYLAVLSLTDILVLYAGLLRAWVGDLSAYDVKNYSDWSCKFINVIGYTVSDYSVWLIIAVTIERYIAVCHPLKASTICSRSHVIKVLPILLVVLLTLNSHFFFTVSLKMRTIADKTVYSCEAKDSFNYLVTHIWPWVDICTYSFVPFVVISILNSRIIYSVVKARRGRSRMQPGAVTSTKKPSPLLNGVSRRNGTTTSSGGHHETSYRLTFMLLTISFTFLMTTLPVNIIHIYALFINPQSLSAVARYTLIKTIAHMLMYCNHSINFFLYCATGEKFRHQLKLLFWRRPGTPRIQYNIKLHSNGTTLHTAAGRSPNRSPNTNRRSNCNHTDNEQLTPTCEAKQQLLDKSENIEMKRILDGDTKPRITTLAINNKSYSYA